MQNYTSVISYKYSKFIAYIGHYLVLHHLWHMDDISSHYGNDNNQISAILPFFIIRKEKENEPPVYNPGPYICQNLFPQQCGLVAYDPSTYLLYLRVKSSLCFRSGPCIILDANLGGNYQDEVVETHLLVWYSVAMTPKLSPVCSHHTHCPSPTSSPSQDTRKRKPNQNAIYLLLFTFLLQKSSKS